MIREITKDEAIRLLAKGKTIWVMNEEAQTWGNLSSVFNNRMIADVEEKNECAVGRLIESPGSCLGSCEIGGELDLNKDAAEEEDEKLDETVDEDRKAEEEAAKPPVEKKGRPSRINWKKVDELNKNGWKVADIAKEVGCSVWSIYDHFRDED